MNLDFFTIILLESADLFIKAVVAVRAEEMFEVETEYTSAALKTALALEEWWKGSQSNREILTSFAHVLRVRLDLFLLPVDSPTQEGENVGSLPPFSYG